MQTVSKHNVKSQHLFQQAQCYIPGGVNSPVRAFKAVGGEPRFIHSAKGAYLIDVDGNQLIDYVGSWGPMILGHAHPAVIQAVVDAAQRGLSFGATCEYEVLLAQEICARVNSIEKVRMVNSGTEATMTAIRLARGVTGRNKILKFEGCYHGHADSLLVKAGSGALTFGVPSSPGVPSGSTQDTLVADFNDFESVQKLFEQHAQDIACIIIEPLAGNMNMVLPKPGFVQSFVDVVPDLTTLGKIIGGGMPVGAVGGRADLMDQLSPQGAIYQAGTLSGNPVAMASGLATLKQLTPEKYVTLASITQQLVGGLKARAMAAKIPFQINHHTGMFGLFFTPSEKVTQFSEVMACNQAHFKAFFAGMLSAGVYLAPSAYEAGFVSLAHTDNEITQTMDAAERAFAALCIA